MDRKQRSQITTGVLMIALGLMFLGDRLDIVPRLDFARLWPVLLIVIGLGNVAFPREDGRHGSGFWLILVGVLFLLDGYRVLAFRQSWPLFIVAGGVSILLGRRHGPAEEGRPVMNGDVPRAVRLTSQVVVGLGVIGFGLLLTARNVGWIDRDQLHHILRFWPLLIVAVGLLKFVRATCAQARVFAGFMMLVGVWLTAGEFYSIEFRFSDWWPLVLVGFGVLLITRATGGPPSPVERGGTGSQEFAFWSGIQRRIAQPNFTGANLTAIMGGIELDLRPAGTASGEAVIDVFALWGGIEITVPPDWAVHNKVTAIMGGADDTSSGTQAARHHLIVRGFVLMGGVEIKN